jgi:hypothetical protein
MICVMFPSGSIFLRITLLLLMLAMLWPPVEFAIAQGSVDGIFEGESVPRQVREMFDSGLRYLQENQAENGSWKTGEAGPGTTSLATLAFLASGEDPNFGRYSASVRRGLMHILRAQDSRSGYIGPTMYHHGFSMLALAEAYGAVNDTKWTFTPSSPPTPTIAGNPPTTEMLNQAPRTIGEGLELAVRCAITSQSKNANRAWRYSPDSRDADTSVTGAILIGLLAAKNAGISVGDEPIDQAVNYLVNMTNAKNGSVSYTQGMDSMGDSTARTAIAVLVLHIAKRSDVKPFESLKEAALQNLDQFSGSWPEYTKYYRAQALFQSHPDKWQRWNQDLINHLASKQSSDGSFPGSLGAANDTSMALLALALNYRFLPIYER